MTVAEKVRKTEAAREKGLSVAADKPLCNVWSCFEFRECEEGDSNPHGG